MSDAAPLQTGLQIRLHLPRKDFALQVDLQLPAHGITVLYGASGSGKTTVLRCVAGLERAQSARVQVGPDVWQDDDSGVFLPPWQRDLGYVFQEASLFEHLDVRRNLSFGLKRAGKPGGERALAEAVELLGIGHLLQRRPANLSGGERQRVAIARALATQPRLLLLDEPLAALDTPRRQEILPWLERIRDEWRIPALYVTHAADELTRLADHLVVLDQGKVRAAGPVEEVLAQVNTPVVVGEDAGVLLTGHVAERDARWQLARVHFAGGDLWVRDSGLALNRPVRLRLLARDISLTLAEPQGTSIQNHFAGRVEAIADDAHPSQALVQVRCGEALIVSRITRRSLHALGIAEGSAVWVQVKSVAVMA